ncbi:MAG: hypothetical protein K2X57_03445 [Xanthobacteraceae bacterium]|nr:hypothetical protein [Xanthobacteraceae bacterium]MBY0611237.1 hypothetical protein [Beijerinckiaceae bacterium]
MKNRTKYNALRHLNETISDAIVLAKDVADKAAESDINQGTLLDVKSVGGTTCLVEVIVGGRDILSRARAALENGEIGFDRTEANPQNANFALRGFVFGYCCIYISANPHYPLLTVQFC